MTAYEFIGNLADRLANRVQLTTDGHKPYLEAVEAAFGSEIDYGMLVKIYGKSQGKNDEIRYSPTDCVESETKWVAGLPDKKYISTTYIERQNLTMRMSMCRFTRLTNGFKKKVENHMHAISLHYTFYNFCRIHKSLRCTPAVPAGVTNRPWEIEGVVNLLLEPNAKNTG